MNCVFSQTAQTQYWLSSTGAQNIEIEQNFDKWTQSTNKRVAMLEIQDFNPDTQTLVERAVDHGDLVILFMPEFITDDWCREFDKPNVVFFLGGILNWQPKHAKLASCLYFFWSTYAFYRAHPNLLEIPNNKKTHCFDILLGRQKPHRDRIHRAVDHKKNIVTYFPTNSDQDIRNYQTSEFIWPNEILPSPDEEISFTVQEVVIDGVIVSLSQIIPQDIYSRTWYTLVAETQNENDWSFFTEKIVKPILAKRLFLVSSGQHYLRNLRRLGFQTFHDVIDESYDNISSAFDRSVCLLNQVDQLMSADPLEIEKRIHSIVEHNFKVLTQTDWESQMILQIRELL